MRIPVNREHTHVSHLISPWQTTFDQAGCARVFNSMERLVPIAHRCQPIAVLWLYGELNHIEVKPNSATVEWWLGVRTKIEC